MVILHGSHAHIETCVTAYAVVYLGDGFCLRPHPKLENLPRESNDDRAREKKEEFSSVAAEAVLAADIVGKVAKKDSYVPSAAPLTDNNVNNSVTFSGCPSRSGILQLSPWLQFGRLKFICLQKTIELCQRRKDQMTTAFLY